LHEAKVEEKMADITARRDELRRKARRVLPEEEITEIKDQIKALTSELKRLRREVKVCGQIRERSGHVRENLATIDRDRQKQKEQER
jgi:prefoldin subunit 5